MFGWCSGGFNRTEPPLPPALLRHHGMEFAYALVCSVRRHRTSIPAAVQEIQCVQGGCALVRGGLSHEFGVVRLYRTFTMYIVTGETRSAGCLCNSSGWFKHIEPHRTYRTTSSQSNHNITEIARCGEVCHMSSGWFDCTEPSLSTLLQGFV